MQQRLYRSEADRMLGGVAAGWAERFGWDPTLVRIALVVVTLLASGILVPVYLALWLITPTYSQVHGTAQAGVPSARPVRAGNWRAIAGAVVLAVGVLALLGTMGVRLDPFWSPFTVVPWTWHAWSPLTAELRPWVYGSALSNLWPVVLIVVGAALMLLRSPRARTSSAADSADTNGETAEDKQHSP